MSGRIQDLIRHHLGLKLDAYIDVYGVSQWLTHFMEFVETSQFTRSIVTLLKDDDYRRLQRKLYQSPRRGYRIRQAGGARKIRWARQGGGKSGGIRAIYYYNEDELTCYMLLAYDKRQQDSLPQAQRRQLKEVIQREFK